MEDEEVTLDNLALLETVGRKEKIFSLTYARSLQVYRLMNLKN